MRNKVRLYIGGKLADLDDGSFILLNYTAEDLSNPTIVRNSFSRQITLKGTPTNNAIFGDIYRNDRITQYGGGTIGPDFDPTRKTPFTIYNDTGEILEDGYLKLDRITRTRKAVSYTVTLYGGLGSFLYGLSYDSDGAKRSLADLDFGETLDFTIDRATVAAAWGRIMNGTGATKWDILNFMPTYDGFPASPFDANKAIVNAAAVGLPTEDGEFTTANGWTLVTLSEKVTGNEAKDFRSYLQRPVARVRKIIEAICNSANNGGYTVNLDADFFNTSNPYWEKAWLTLPAFSELNISLPTSTEGTNITQGTVVTVPGGGVSSTLYTLKVRLNPYVDQAVPALPLPANCKMTYIVQDSDENYGFFVSYLEFTLEVFDSNNNVIGTNVFRVSTGPFNIPAQYPQMDYVFDHIGTDGTFRNADGSAAVVQISGSYYGAASVRLTYRRKGIVWGNTSETFNPYAVYPVGYPLSSAVDVNITLPQGSLVAVAVPSQTVRTGATITKAALLSTGHTPADYLISYCKMFGLQIVPHRGEKVIDILLRKNYYRATTVDISGRVNRGREIEKTPFSFDARWYTWGAEYIGEWAETYANKYGLTYGDMRLNTGYEFDASEKPVTDSVIFRGAASVMETSKYFCDLNTLGTPIPAVFLGGGKYTLYKALTESKQYDLPSYAAAAKTWNNTAYPMHDDFPKLQLHGPENVRIEDRDTLVFYNFPVAVGSEHASLTDDIQAMLNLNGSTPCWLPNYCDYDGAALLQSLPFFSRYVLSGGVVSYSWDYGTPREAMLPGVTFQSGNDVFSRYWEKYIGDRYDDDSAVVTCEVDLRGLQVGVDLLRQFYAFDGAIWALNRIIDYSLTTAGPTRCEFVKVQDISNYTTL